MSEFFIYEGKRYRLVNRKAEVGEKVVDLFDSGKVLTIINPPYECGKEWCSFKTEHGTDIAPIGQNEYAVLEPVENEASPDIHDLLANLARRVASLEQQLRDTQSNCEKLAEELADAKYNAKRHIESLTCDIITLDKRSQVLNAINKFYEECGR